LDLEGREEETQYRITGECTCGQVVDIVEKVTGDAVVPICPACGSKLLEYDIEQLDG